MKRFWDHATVAETDRVYSILLDGKPMRIPGGAALRIESATLAQAIADEWQAAGGHKGGEMTAEEVPLTRLAGTAQDRIAPDKAPVAEALAAYAETDVLCYRAEHPLPLVTRQTREWEPWLDWLAATHGARLRATEGIAHLEQDSAAVSAVHDVLGSQSALILAGLGIVVPALGSVVLGLALADGALDARRAYEIANLEELFQAEQWGEDAWAAKRRLHMAHDIEVAARFIALAQAP